MNRLRNIIQILGALALALAPTWSDPSVPLAGKISASLAMAFSVLVAPQFKAEALHLILGVCAIGGVAGTIWIARMSTGTSSYLVVGTVIAVLSNLRTALGMQAKAIPAQSPDPTPVTENIRPPANPAK